MENILNPFIGGVIIGLAATVLLLFNGKIMGMSGIINGALSGLKHGAYLWRYTFILGMLLGGLIVKIVSPEFFHFEFKTSLMQTALAGVIVGFGVLIGNGCTSGHGVCGLPRLSPLSLVATLTFMATAIIVVAIKGALS